MPAEGAITLDGMRIASYEHLVDHLVEQLGDENTRFAWTGTAVGLGTVNAFARRLISSKRDLSRLIRGDLAQRRPHSINTAESAQLTVVDLHNLPDRAQRFVVGVTLKTEFERKEKAGHREAAAVRGARRAQQVRAARGLVADQGRAARHRRARPLASASC